MPTPFSHLVVAQQLFDDAQIPPMLMRLLEQHKATFLLGNIAPDARVPGAGRDATHFYRFNEVIKEHLWKRMLAAFPTLSQPQNGQHFAFLLGYVAHLAVDEWWAVEVVHPHFARPWQGKTIRDQFIGLHLALIYLDERDLPQIKKNTGQSLLRVEPDGWLPFMPDSVLSSWRDFVGSQLLPDGESRTMEIYGARIGLKPKEIRHILDDEATLKTRLWDYVPKNVITTAPDGFYPFARDQLIMFYNHITTNP